MRLRADGDDVVVVAAVAGVGKGRPVVPEEPEEAPWSRLDDELDMVAPFQSN